MKSFADVYEESLVVGDPAKTAKAIMKAIGLSAGQAAVLQQPVLMVCESRAALDAGEPGPFLAEKVVQDEQKEHVPAGNRRPARRRDRPAGAS